MYYQVTISLSEDVSPPYQEWLEEHVEEMLALTAANGNKLFTSADIEQKDNKFDVIYKVTKDNFAYYEAAYADKMRSEFMKTYADKMSAFSFERKTVEE